VVQGGLDRSEERFGHPNRLFLVLHNRSDPKASWTLKREMDWLRERRDALLPRETVSEEDAISFRFRGREYRALAKVFLLVWPPGGQG